MALEDRIFMYPCSKKRYVSSNGETHKKKRIANAVDTNRDTKACVHRTKERCGSGAATLSLGLG